MALAKSLGLDIVTDATHIHEVVAGQSEEDVLAALLGGNLSTKKAPAADDTEASCTHGADANWPALVRASRRRSRLVSYESRPMPVSSGIISLRTTVAPGWSHPP